MGRNNTCQPAVLAGGHLNKGARKLGWAFITDRLEIELEAARLQAIETKGERSLLVSETSLNRIIKV